MSCAPSPSFNARLLGALAAAVCGCAPGVSGGPRNGPAAIASESPSAVSPDQVIPAAAAPSEPESDGLPRVFPRASLAIRDRGDRGLFSPDGRYIVLDDIVVDLETKAPIPFDCDLRYFAWYSGPRVACINGAHTALAVLDLRDHQLKSYACDASGPLDSHLRVSERFAICGQESRDTRTLVDIETGSTHVVPATAGRVWEQGGRTVALLTRLSDEQNGYINQLWDVTGAKPIGEPYLWQNTQSALSPDGRWAFGANRADGQFVVDLKSGARRVVGTAKEIPNGLTSVAPFSADSTKVAVFAPKGVRVVEVASGSVLATLTATGCETAITVKFSPNAGGLVVGGDQSNVCVFSLKSATLLWRADLSGKIDFSLDGVDESSPYVIDLEFTRDGEGVVAAGTTGSSRGWGALLRAATGEVVMSFPETKYMWRDVDGDLLTFGFLFGPALSVTPRTAPGGVIMCDGYAGGAPYYPCLKGQAPEPPPWRGSYFLSVDPKLQRVAGIVGDQLRVWSVTGELIYAQ